MLKEDDNVKKSKKKPDDSAMTVPASAPSAVDDKASTEDAKALEIIANTPKETINTAPEIIDTSRATSSLGADQEKDPPLT